MNKIKRYNKLASLPKNKSKDILNALQINEGDHILEIGVGGGYFAQQMSLKIGKSGLYYGIDTNDLFLDNLEKLNYKLQNIRTIKSTTSYLPNLDENFDLVFTRNVYHHLENRSEYFKQISEQLSENGRIAIIDYNESFSLWRLSGHYTRKQVIINELKNAGLKLKQEYDFLHKQSFLVFGK
jgi:ubiquinone/menaquinone biosynthesis C-methylase UbiE